MGEITEQKATILLIGVDLTKMYIYSWSRRIGPDIPGRLTMSKNALYDLPDQTEISVPQRRHIGHTSEKYNRVEDIFLNNQAMYKGQFGDATVRGM